jgi:hypothetical protein
MKRNFPRIVSFYTVGTGYQLEVERLIASCATWGLRSDIVGIPSQGSWELNCAYKPFFLLEKLREWNEPLLWVDADAEIVRSPSPLSCFDSDLALYTDPDLDPHHRSKVRSGTIFVNATPGGTELVKAWASECHRQLLDPHRTQEFWDQEALRNLTLRPSPPGRIGSLPLAYVQIADHPKDSALELWPIILHYQASRRWKEFLTAK